MTEKRLSAADTAAYALPAFALAGIGVPLYIHLPKYYSDVVGVPVALVGTILLAARLFDAVLDPLIGRISDSTTSSWGRRRPYIAIGSVFVAIFVWALLNPPVAARDYGAVWLAASLFLTFVAWTVVTIPYEALVPEISRDYDDRTRLTAVRDGALIAGFLFAASLPFVGGSLAGIQTETEKIGFMAWVLAPLMAVSGLICVWRVKEVSREPARTPSPASLTAFRIKPFRILFIAYAINAIGSNLPATLMLYYVEYVLQSAREDLFLVLYLATGIVALPFWVWLSGRTSKKIAWLATMAVNTGAFALVPLLQPGAEFWFGVLTVISGTGSAASIALPASMQADVIDLDELESGHRREGLFMGLWSIARKASAALGIGAALPILSVVGYKPNIAQSADVILAIKSLYAGVPCAFSVISMLVISGYHLDRDDHQSIRTDLAVEGA